MMIYEIKVGSVTNAQRGAKLLKNAGYRVFVHKQLRLAESLQAKQEYFLPMFLGEQLAGVHLILQQRAGAVGAV